jgi:23S rRNA (guanosine2251-2'-O)-methyltransferase
MAPADGSDSQREILYGLHAVREALKAGARPLQRILVVRTDKQFADIVQLARARRVPVHVQPLASLDRLVPGGRHQGVVAYTAAKAYQSEESILERAAARNEPPLLVILDGVEDPHNLGAVLRTAEGAGVHGVFIPERRAAGLTSVVAKVSAGAVDHIPVARVTNTVRLIESLKAAGIWIYGVDPSATKLFTEVDLRGPVGLVSWGAPTLRRAYPNSHEGSCSVAECLGVRCGDAVRGGPSAQSLGPAGGWLADLQHAALDGRFEELGRIRNPHFLHHVGAVRLHGFHADLEALPNFLVLEPGPNQFENFLFARGQGLRALGPGRGLEVRERLPNSWLPGCFGHDDQFSFEKRSVQVYWNGVPWERRSKNQRIIRALAHKCKS